MSQPADDETARARTGAAILEAAEHQREQLAAFAKRAVALGLTGETAVLFLIAVDSPWKVLIDHMSRQVGDDWTLSCAGGGIALACGIAVREGFSAVVSGMAPALGPVLAHTPPPGVFFAVILLEHASGIVEVAREPQIRTRADIRAELERMSAAELERVVERMLAQRPLPPHPGLEHAAVVRSMAAFLRLGGLSNRSPMSVEIAKLAGVNVATVVRVHRWARSAGLVG